MPENDHESSWSEGGDEEMKEKRLSLVLLLWLQVLRELEMEWWSAWWQRLTEGEMKAAGSNAKVVKSHGEVDGFGGDWRGRVLMAMNMP